ncbi:MAG: ROK family transcriptional regulator [Adhaeribacter sp.]
MDILTLEDAYVKELNNIERKKFFQKLKIIKFLYIKGAQSNADICERFRISSPTSIGLLNELIAEGYVEKQGRGHSIGGRKPDLYGLQDNSLFVLGIEMGQYNTRMAIFNNRNEAVSDIKTFSIPISKDLSALEDVYECAMNLILASGINSSKLLGIGISMPGLVSQKEGRNHTYLLTEEDSESLQQILENKFKKPVFLQNDVKAATLAEYRFGLAKSRRDVLVISMDWGIGIGMIMDGKLRTGTSGFAGEFGHIPMVEDGVLCYCGKRGCLETVASGNALARLAMAGIQSGQSTRLQEFANLESEQIAPKVVIDAAHHGDQYAINILSEIGLNLGKGIAVLIQLFNPELIILGGKMAEANQYIAVPIQQSINTYCMTQLREKASIAMSTLGPDAGILGAVATVMENIFMNYTELTR